MFLQIVRGEFTEYSIFLISLWLLWYKLLNIKKHGAENWKEFFKVPLLAYPGALVKFRIFSYTVS